MQSQCEQMARTSASALHKACPGTMALFFWFPRVAALRDVLECCCGARVMSRGQTQPTGHVLDVVDAAAVLAAGGGSCEAVPQAGGRS